MLALDIGTVWTGVALSDSLRMLARPVTAVRAPELTEYLTQLFKKEMIGTIVVGYPRTMQGLESEQTRQVCACFELLRVRFSDKEWLLWDERLSSKRAAQPGARRTQAGRLHEQARAAAHILDLYLTYLTLHAPPCSE